MNVAPNTVQSRPPYVLTHDLMTVVRDEFWFVRLSAAGEYARTCPACRWTMWVDVLSLAMANMPVEYAWRICLANMPGKYAGEYAGEYVWRICLTICLANMPGEYAWRICLANMPGKYAGEYVWRICLTICLANMPGEYDWKICRQI